MPLYQFEIVIIDQSALLLPYISFQTPKSLQFESNTEHDGDIEDISDGERTSSDHGMTFFPNVPGTPT